MSLIEKIDERIKYYREFYADRYQAKSRREIKPMPDRCVCCDDIIPEGTQVCWSCLKGERYTSKRKNIMRKLKRLLKG